MGQRSDTTKSRAVWAVLAGAACTATAHAQDASLAAAPEVEIESPPDLPGHVDGPQTKPMAPIALPPPAPSDQSQREWLGGLPWFEWTRATGDWGGGGSGLRTGLEDVGLTIAGSYTLDWSSVWAGGLSRRASTRTLFNVNLNADLEHLLGLEGGSAFADFLSSDMRGGSRDAGDAMGIDDAETGENVDQVSELWYQQAMLGGLLRVKIGKIDANTEFNATSTNALHMHATAATNLTMFNLPTWPDPAMGVLAVFTPVEWAYASAGIFDGGLAEGRGTGRHGPRDLWHGSAAYCIAEGGLRWGDLCDLGPGRAGLGAWYSGGSHARFDGDTQNGTAGGYLVAEQRLLPGRERPDEAEAGLFAYFRAGFADDHVVIAGFHLAAGLSLHGTFDGRAHDTAGLTFAFADLSDDPAAGTPDDEFTVEVFYRIAITPWLTVMPDVQFIVNPGGTGTLDDAVVGALRVEISF